jgi:hypothetical protein
MRPGTLQKKRVLSSIISTIGIDSNSQNKKMSQSMIVDDYAGTLKNYSEIINVNKNY